MNQFAQKRQKILIAQADARADYERASLAHETSASKQNKDRLEALRAELDSHERALNDLSAAERAARRRAEENAARDLAAERAADLATCKEGGVEVEEGAALIRDGGALVGRGYEKLEAGRNKMRAAVFRLGGAPILSGDLDQIVAHELVRHSDKLFVLAGCPTGIDRTTDVVAIVKRISAKLLAQAEHAASSEGLPPAA